MTWVAYMTAEGEHGAVKIAMTEEQEPGATRLAELRGIVSGFYRARYGDWPAKLKTWARERA